MLNKKANTLFPKLKGPNEPPVLTTDSQPKIEVNQLGLATLPKMRVNGSKPKFQAELKDKNPYQKN